MSNYTKTTDFEAKDSLPSGDSGKIIRGSEFETEFDNIATAIATKADAASPTFTGTVTIDGLTVNGNTTLGNAATDTVTVTADIASNLIPSADDTYNLGASGAEWNDLFIDGTANIDSLVADTADINGGTIDGVTIGGTTAGAITGTTITGTGFVTSGDMTFGDNDKAIFGAGSDLEIFHTGAYSGIKDSGTGALRISATNIEFRNAADTKFYANGVDGGAFNLYYDNAQKLATTSTGVDVTGTIKGEGLQASAANPGVSLFESDTTDLNAHLNSNFGSFRIATISDVGGSYTQRINVDHATGDIRFYEDTGSTAKFHWDASAESLGIGTSSPSAVLDVTGPSSVSSDTTISEISFFKSGGTATTNVKGLDISLGSGDVTAGYDITNLYGAYINNSTSGASSTVINNWYGVYVPAVDADRTANAVSAYFGDNVGIGTASPKTSLDISSGTGSAPGPELTLTNGYAALTTGDRVGAINFYTSDGSNRGPNNSAVIEAQAATSLGHDANLVFKTGVPASEGQDAVETMRIDYQGHVGIGTSSPSVPLHVFSSSPELRLQDSDDNGYLSFNHNGVNSYVSTTQGGILFRTGGTTERMRITSGGHLLVGKTAQDSTNTVGFEAKDDGLAVATTDGAQSLILNRKTSDGTIAEFRKDNSAVGSIGSLESKAYVAGPDVGIRFGSTGLIPTESTGNNNDNSVDLGASSARFKDLYLSGGVYLGGTAAANKLDDYEEGTWTPVLSDAASAGNTGTATTASGRYTKVGNLVTVQVFLFNIDTTGMTGGNTFHVQSLPFTSSSGNSGAVGATQASSVAFTGYVNAFLGSSRTYLYFRDNASGLGGSNIAVSDLTSGSADLYFTVTYEAA